jgi:hypothetical protein
MDNAYKPVCFRTISSRPENGFVACFAGFLRLFAGTGVTSFLSPRHRPQGVQNRPRVQTYLEGDGINHCAVVRSDQDISRSGHWRTKMGEVIRFITRAELERARLSRERRARPNAMLPQAASVSVPHDQKSELADS